MGGNWRSPRPTATTTHSSAGSVRSKLGAPVLTSVAFVEGRTRIRGRNNSRLAAIAVPIERDHVRLGVLTAEIDASRSDRVSADSAALVQLLASQMSGSLVALSPLAARAAAAAKARGPSPRPQTEVLPAYEAAPPVGADCAEPRTDRRSPPRRPSAPPQDAPVTATTMSEDDSDSALREARSRFIAGFRKRCSSIEELIVEVEQKGTDGPLLALKQIVHRLSGLATVVGMQEVSARAAELDLLLDAPRASLDAAPLRKAFENMQDAFTTDLAVVAPVWAAPSGQAVGALVMLVTSDAELASRMTADLQSSAYRVTQTGNGHRALLVARSERPDMILLDVDLAGEMDGHGVCRRLKSDPAVASIPIVLVSSHTSTVDRMAGFALGADDYLTKPVQTIEMLLRVRWILTRPSTERQPPPRAGGGLLTYDAFVTAAREVLQQGAAALGVVRVSHAQMPDLAALFSDDLRRKDLLGRYTDTQLVVLMPGATAGVASRRIGGVLDIARAAGLDMACAGVTASGLSAERFIEPLLAQAESALSAAQVQGEAVVVHGSATRRQRLPNQALQPPGTAGTHQWPVAVTGDAKPGAPAGRFPGSRFDGRQRGHPGAAARRGRSAPREERRGLAAGVCALVTCRCCVTGAAAGGRRRHGPAGHRLCAAVLPHRDCVRGADLGELGAAGGVVVPALPRIRDLMMLFALGILENFGYRQ